MRYYEKSGDKFIANGNSLARVGLVTHKPSPVQAGRTLKVVEVLEVIRLNADNPIVVGTHLALSFPNEKLYAKEYQWYRDGWEECFVQLKISDRAVMRTLAGITK